MLLVHLSLPEGNTVAGFPVGNVSGDRTRAVGLQNQGFVWPGKKKQRRKAAAMSVWFDFFMVRIPAPPPSPALTTVRTSVLENELTLYNLSMYLIHSGCGVAYVVTCFGSVSLNTTWDCGQITSLRGTLYLCFKNARCFHRDLTISSGLLGSPCSSGTGKRQIRYSYFTAWENKAEFRKLP